MGSIFSRRGQKSTIDVLQEIDKDIDDLETNQADKEFNRRQVVGYLIILSVFLFIGLGIYWYVSLFPPGGLTWRHYSLACPVILCYCALVCVLKWTICWWYEQSLSIDERKLGRLRRRKREILDTVKDKETYKVAKEILERFDPQVRQEKVAKKAREFQQQLAMMRRYASLEGSALTTPSPPATTGHQQVIRNRIANKQSPKSRSPSPTNFAAEGPLRSISHDASGGGGVNIPHTDSTLSVVHPPTPQPKEPTATATAPPPMLLPVSEMRSPLLVHRHSTTPPPNTLITASQPTLISSSPFVGSFTAPPPPNLRAMVGGGAAIPTPGCLPRPVVPRERSILDRMIDFLLGEGPANRYALICQNCRSHNGMALKEELETMAFRCCYCFTFNPARKYAQQTQMAAASPAAPSSSTPVSAEVEQEIREEPTPTPPPMVQQQDHLQGLQDDAGADSPRENVVMPPPSRPQTPTTPPFSSKDDISLSSSSMMVINRRPASASDLVSPHCSVVQQPQKVTFSSHSTAPSRSNSSASHDSIQSSPL